MDDYEPVPALRNPDNTLAFEVRDSGREQKANFRRSLADSGCSRHVYRAALVHRGTDDSTTHILGECRPPGGVGVVTDESGSIDSAGAKSCGQTIRTFGRLYICADGTT
ncbi:hypothetical protein EVAR_24589_1 [Eumeta japonica]|uniref:Uncharacterized protein n=1 Tax=Eumeta variegata TaxID=151549 RepID=A0A4C1W6K8_EUMVA|nr:hypothetical protein EVAR_24589_1 [Eumeta japonica]